jgi:hypothetical protein
MSPDDQQTGEAAGRLQSIPDALHAASRLAAGPGDFDEDTGEPLDSDAELEVLSTRILDAWKRLHDDAHKVVLEAYKDHLLYDASRNFLYEGMEEESMGAYYEGRWEGVRAALGAMGFEVDLEGIRKKGLDELIAELKRDLPEKRRLAAEHPDEFRRQIDVEEAETALEALTERASSGGGGEQGP